MPTKGSKKLTEQKFSTITNQLGNNVNTPDMLKVIAKANGVTESTVREIRGVKSWDKWQARRAKKATATKAKAVTQVKTVKRITVKAEDSDLIIQLVKQMEVIKQRQDGQQRLLRRLSDWVQVVEHNSIKRVWGRK